MDEQVRELAKTYEDMGYTIKSGVNQYLCRAKRYHLWHVIPLLKSNGKTKDKRIYVWAMKDLRNQAGLDSLDKAIADMDENDPRLSIFKDKRSKIIDFLAGIPEKRSVGRPRKVPEKPI